LNAECTRLSIVQQARAEDLAAVRGEYARLGSAEIAPFFLTCRRVWRRHIWSSPLRRLDGSRAVGHRPACTWVPLPHALDQDQFANAGILEDAGGAIRIEQSEFTAERLAAQIAALLNDPARLSRMAQAAKRAGTIDAADRLADLVLKVARN
jgi:UDP-N-acetylglucosamine--N-acetylmuramyl-(pentapeptide) pyrophosphoryl-undecaprenol N-acetylglucosamine transferase